MLIQNAANRLLRLLPDQVCAELLNHAVVVNMVKGTDLTSAGEAITSCWFPITGMVSAIVSDKDGNEADVGLIGYEGMVNSSVLGSRHSHTRVLVQIEGTAAKVDARKILELAQRDGQVLRLLTAYNHELAVQTAQAVLASASYTVLKRLARWILMCSDRLDDGHIDLTHEAMALMLNVRRAGITGAMQSLVAVGAVATRYGGTRIVDRETLIDLAGSAYEPGEVAYRRLIGNAMGGPN